MPNDPATRCECGCHRAQHANSRGMCNGYKCRCSRFIVRTRQFVHMQMMQDALSAAIEMIEDLPGRNRQIKTCLPDNDERAAMVRQMKAAISGPSSEVKA